MTARVLRIAALGALVVIATAAVRVWRWAPAAVREAPVPGNHARAAGVVHVHTVHSDGSGTVDDVARAAAASGLDFVVITDHGAFDAAAREGYADGVLLIAGAEASTGAGHLLVLDMRPPTYRFSDAARDVLDDVQSEGAVAFAAHPDHARDEFRWTGWDLPGPWGIELFNGDSAWRRAPWSRLARGLATYGVNPAYGLSTILASPNPVLEHWDRLLAERDVPAIAGADAHGGVEVLGRLSLPLPSYEAIFRAARMHVLLDAPLGGDAARDRAAVIESIARGRGYIGLDGLAPAGRFGFVATSGGRQWTMGETVPASETPQLRAGGALPAGARLSLLHDGRVIAESAEPLEWSAAVPGVYRVEVRLPEWPTPWIMSNPIYVFDADTAQARQRRAGWPVAADPAPVAVVLEDFERAPYAFELAADDASSGTLEVSLRGDRPGSAAHVRFSLDTDRTPWPFAGLSSRQTRDLSHAAGLTLAVKSDRPYRLWAQVHERTAAAGDGVESWFASVKTSPEWRTVSVPFDRLRTRESRSGPLDLRRVEELVFVIDPASVPAGASGTVWIDDIGLYRTTGPG